MTGHSPLSDSAIVREVGLALKEARVRRGMTQAEVAKIMGVESQTIYMWEKGKRDPGTINIVRLAKIYRVAPGLFYEDMEKNIERWGEGNEDGSDAGIEAPAQEMDMLAGAAY